ncbi:thiamine-phosphate kinase [Microbispora triticiradicis]|uniref:Thiamine-monophosphate kinase n=3 Tax=Microbispora TaxID=2005 RepID=A0ABY3M0S9_9ACTN|nr:MULTISPECIES: thiamine-phosphate kinase [Microbispora]RGA06058.1 thiamine-phosphate kinase [Microbispora triticiradicis]TLP52799.1 thiamine-phosphate kinase [Microbispora fusca]TYB62875.1 thiamine-phosphate kinase [Microbispora tritici]GLW24452.1 thiamine-monophosphate kinase [Microbispora amethystogenes]
MHKGCAITVGELGEFGVIQRISGRLTQGAAVLLGPGDDAAILRAPDGRVVVSTDLLVEGRHFRRDWSGGYDIGRKAAAQNLADIAAMGADPTALVVGLGLPPDAAADWLDALTDGFRDECDLVGATVAGGDVTRSEIVVLGVTALGDLGGRPPVTRSGARPGDVVAVAGRLGHAAAGLALLTAGAGAGSPELRELPEAHRRPRPPYACGPRAALLGATAMLDVSDGLLQDLGHVAEASGVAVALDAAALPVAEVLAAAAGELGADPLEWVLTGGDDHALAATFPPAVRLPPEWTVIGEVEQGQGVRVDGQVRTVGGWDHFRE